LEKSLANKFEIMILPFWIQAMTDSFDSNLSSSRVAEFVLFISGAVIAFAHFFLRANAVRTAIKPSNTPWLKRRKFRLFGPSDLEMMPISSPMTLMKPGYNPEEKMHIAPFCRSNTGVLSSPTATTPGSITGFLQKPEVAVSRPQWPLSSGSPQPPVKSPRTLDMKISQSPITPSSHRRNQASYSLFPGADDIKLPSTVYSPESQHPPKSSKNVASKVTESSAALTAATKSLSQEDLLAPKQPRLPWAPGHGRNSSADSSATVQIGIRFSAAPAALTASNTLPNPKRGSRRVVVDTTDPFANKPLPAPQKSPLSSNRLDAPFEPQRPQHKRQRSDHPSDYSRLDIQDSPTQLGQSRPTYMKRQNSQRELAESNRKEMADLERSGSASKPKPRPAYPNPAPPSDGKKSKGGFF